LELRAIVVRVGLGLRLTGAAMAEGMVAGARNHLNLEFPWAVAELAATG